MYQSLRAHLLMQMNVDGNLAYDVTVHMDFRSTTPYQVSFTFFLAGDLPTRWIIGRDLLLAGLDGPSGLGDVRIQPLGLDMDDPEWEEDVTIIQLSSPTGHIELWASTSALSMFLLRTSRLVPFGEEFPAECLDRMISEIIPDPNPPQGPSFLT